MTEQDFEREYGTGHDEDGYPVWSAERGSQASVRNRSSDDMDGLGELAGVTEPVAVVLRGDGSVDVYGLVAVIDQRPCPSPEHADEIEVSGCCDACGQFASQS
jgi:hypothetical protein